jgi:serine/threonine protein kinase
MLGEDNKTYLIDFGLAQRFRNPHTQVHIPKTSGSEVIGTVRYTSINSHRGLQHSRRDDLESLAYTLIYLLKGALPWQRSESTLKEQRVSIVQKKLEFCRNACDSVPVPLTLFLRYAQSLAFEEQPDYMYLYSLLKDMAIADSESDL